MRTAGSTGAEAMDVGAQETGVVMEAYKEVREHVTCAIKAAALSRRMLPECGNCRGQLAP